VDNEGEIRRNKTLVQDEFLVQTAYKVEWYSSQHKFWIFKIMFLVCLMLLR